MRKICTVTADLPQLVPALEMKMGAHGRFWIVNFEIVIRFGGTRLRAYMKWKDEVGRHLLGTMSTSDSTFSKKSGKERRGPASIIPGTAF
jgi:hypothetical protein